MNATSPPLLHARAAPLSWNVWPTATQTLLLRAALAEDATGALGAWARWRDAVDFENLDYGSHRLLPLLHRNLVRHGAEPHPWFGRMKGLHRHSWVRNQRLLAAVAGLARAMREELGTGVMLLKGAALATCVYPDAGLRPMDDADLLVPPAAVPGALALLERRGWKPVGGWADTGRPLAAMPARRRRFSHAQNFVAEGNHGLGVDLHWRALNEAGVGPESNESLWPRALPVTLPDGTPVLAPDPTDLLVHVCLHGLRASAVPPVRWAADATLLLRRSATATAGTGAEGRTAAVDWERLHRFAVTHAFTRRLGAALDFLADTLDAPVPEDTRARLRSRLASWGEREEFRVVVGGECPPEIGLGGRLAYRLLRLRSSPEAGGAAGATVAGWRLAADYFCVRWNVPHPVLLPFGAGWQGARRAWRLAAWWLRRRTRASARQGR